MRDETAHQLTDRIADLVEKVRVSEEQQERTETLAKEAKTLATKLDDQRKILWGAVAVIAVLLVMVIIGAFEYQDQQTAIQGAVDANQDAQVTSCENANKTRASQIYLWETIIAQSAARRDPGEPPPTEDELQYLEDFQTFIRKIFAERDCENLDKEYPLPEAPPIPGQN
jgi:type II secretory pathway pseudopilin PulG